MTLRAATLRHGVVRHGGAAAMLALRAGRPAIAWQLREALRFGVASVVIDGADIPAEAETALHAIAAGLPRPLGLRVARGGPADIATGLDARILTLDARLVFDGNVARLLQAAAADGSDAPGMALWTEDGRATGLACVQRDALLGGMDLAALPRCTAPGRLDEAASSGAPVPLPRPALFLDRDGTVNVDHGYVGTRDRFTWIAGARAAIARATGSGWHVFIVTNQSGVARGFYDEAAVDTLHAWLADAARREGGTIDDVRYCPFHPDAALPAYRRACDGGPDDWRKPGPGMLHDLVRAWELDPRLCRMVGDQPSDVAAARAAGVAGHLFPGGDLDAFIRPLLAIPAPASAPV